MGYKLGYYVLVLSNQVLLINSVLTNEVLLNLRTSIDFCNAMLSFERMCSPTNAHRQLPHTVYSCAHMLNGTLYVHAFNIFKVCFNVVCVYLPSLHTCTYILAQAVTCKHTYKQSCTQMHKQSHTHIHK